MNYTELSVLTAIHQYGGDWADKFDLQVQLHMSGPNITSVAKLYPEFVEIRYLPGVKVAAAYRWIGEF